MTKIDLDLIKLVDNFCSCFLSLCANTESHGGRHLFIESVKSIADNDDDNSVKRNSVKRNDAKNMNMVA